MRIHRPLIARTLRPGIAIAIPAGLALVAGTAAASATVSPAASFSFTVNSTADSHDAHPGDGVCADSQGRCTLRAAVEEADAEPAGSTIAISVPAGTYALTLGTLDESANTITVTGAGAASTIVNGNRTFGVVQVGKAVTAGLTGVTISGGNAGPSGYGGGVLSAGRTTISHSTVSGNTAAAGGGITNSGGTLTITASTVSGNTASAYGGAGIQNGGLKNLPGTVTVTSSTIKNNTASGDGGGILNGQNGHPAAAGRAAARPLRWAARAPRRDAPARVRPARVRPARVRPARVRPAAASLTVTVSKTTISGNTSDNAGGAIANDGGTVTVTRSTLTNNTCPNAIGGGIETYGPLTVTRSTLTGNSAAGGYGGGIEVYYGGVAGSTTVTQSTLTGNSAIIGAGIDDSNMVTITASTLSGNSAHQAGGGVEVEGSASLSVVNSTLTGNTTAMSGNGGGIQTYACSGGTVSYSTISGNSTGLDLSCSTLQLTGTIVANSAGANCIGATPSEAAGYNLDSGTSCGFAKSTDLNSANPKLGPLANNGGPTQTELPQPGSPAINHGGLPANGCPATDQRGDPRPFGPACDIGSVEVQG